MKKTKLWKRIAGWLLVFLLVLQLPVNAFAEDWNANEAYTSEETDLAGQDILEEDISADEQVDSEEGTLSDDQVDLTEEDTDDIQIAEDGDSEFDLETEEPVTGESEFTDGSAALFSDGTDQSEGETGESKEIQVTVSVSKDGEFLDDKDGKPMAGRVITLSGQSSYTMDDALRVAHDLYYPGGAEAGYDYHADDAGIFDGVIYRLWGYDKKNVPYIKSSLNRNSANYGSALGRTVENGDEMHFFIQSKKGQDKLAFFTEEEQTVTEGQPIVLRLRQEDDAGRAYSECEGASIYIDGIKQENIVTDAEGKVTLPELEAREKPYFITVEKRINNNGTEITAISAAYANITVVPGGVDKGDYISSVRLCIKNSETEVKEESVNAFDGTQAFNFPIGFSHGEFYVNVSTMESIPEGCTLYAVYTSPLDDTVKRVKLSQDSSTLLKNTSVKYSSKAILSIGFEVRKNGNILQSVEVPIHYKARLNELTVSDSWGHEFPTGLQDTTESQNLEVTVPENTEYIDIAGSDNDCYGSIAENPEQEFSNE